MPQPISMKCPLTAEMANLIRERRPTVKAPEVGHPELDNLAMVIGAIYREYDSVSIQTLMNVFQKIADRRLPTS